MQSTIGVYDSGIGGLHTLALLMKKLPAYNYYYLADNARMPFGSKSKEEITDAVSEAIAILETNSDITVIACNTASTVADPKDAFKLKPKLSGLDAKKTLVLATPSTLSQIGANELFFNTAATPDLASLIEIQAALRFKSKTNLDMSPLFDYINFKLLHLTNSNENKKEEISTVVLGCSHYIYLKTLLERLFPFAAIKDGNDVLCDDVCSFISSTADLNEKTSPSVKFDFTGISEEKKYKWILEKLLIPERSNAITPLFTLHSPL